LTDSVHCVKPDSGRAQPIQLYRVLTRLVPRLSPPFGLRDELATWIGREVSVTAGRLLQLCDSCHQVPLLLERGHLTQGIRPSLPLADLYITSHLAVDSLAKAASPGVVVR